jgi:hypothetical protein
MRLPRTESPDIYARIDGGMQWKHPRRGRIVTASLPSKDAAARAFSRGHRT